MQYEILSERIIWYPWWSCSIAMLVHITFATNGKRLQHQICRWLIWLKSRSQIGDERRSWVNLFFCIWAARSPPLCCHLTLCLTKWSLKMTAAGDWKRWIWIKSGESFCFYTSETSSKWLEKFRFQAMILTKENSREQIKGCVHQGCSGCDLFAAAQNRSNHPTEKSQTAIEITNLKLPCIEIETL